MADPETETETAAEKPDDIRSMLAEAMAEQDAPATDKPAEKPSTEPAPAAEKPTDGRARGPDGKFAKADDAAEPAPEPADKVAAKPEATAETKAEPTKAGEPPANWSEADKTAFKGLPPEGQAFLMRRHTEMEADYTRKTQQIASFRRDFEPVAQMFAPHAQIMRDKGFTPATLIQSWYNVEKALVDGKGVDIVKGIVQGYNLDKAALARALGITGAATPAPSPDGQPPAPQPEAPQAQLPPEVAQRLERHEAWIAQQERERQESQQNSRREAESRVMSEIEKFSSAVDSAGKPLHPHFAAVEDAMTRHAIAARTGGFPVPPLAELYDQAVWANPSTREKLLAEQSAAQEAQRAAAEEKRKADARAKADQARRAGAPVTGAPGTGQTRAKPGDLSLRDQLLEAADEAA